MLRTPTIKGKFITLRPVVEEDAEYILTLRTNPNLNTFLNAVDSDVEKQRKWIAEHNERAESHYFMMLDGKEQSCGMIRLHDITSDSCTFGSWIMSPECSGFYAIESLVLCFSYALETLGCGRVLGRIHERNQLLKKIYDAIGAIYICSKNDFLEYEMTQENFKAMKKKYHRFNTYILT